MGAPTSSLLGVSWVDARGMVGCSVQTSASVGAFTLPSGNQVEVWVDPQTQKWGAHVGTASATAPGPSTANKATMTRMGLGEPQGGRGRCAVRLRAAAGRSVPSPLHDGGRGHGDRTPADHP